MPVLVQNREIAKRLLKEREALGNQSRDEVWDGVTVIMPEADVEHDDIAGFFYRAFWSAFGESTGHHIQFRVNVSDRVRGWKQNYRIPDTSIFLTGNPAKLCGTHYAGGPDFALGSRANKSTGHWGSMMRLHLGKVWERIKRLAMGANAVWVSRTPRS